MNCLNFKQTKLMEKKDISFSSTKDFINWLIDNEGKVLADAYGRQWKYKGYNFYYKDIGSDNFKIGIEVLHLYNTPMTILPNTSLTNEDKVEKFKEELKALLVKYDAELAINRTNNETVPNWVIGYINSL